jgi:hypothetical protein
LQYTAGNDDDEDDDDFFTLNVTKILWDLTRDIQ